MSKLLICFPFAGAGTVFFRPWQSKVREVFDFKPVLLPGRERRLFDPTCVTIEAAIDDTMAALGDALPGASTILVFGHSLGAILAYAFAARVETLAADITHLFVSGSPAPHKQRTERATGLDDDAFIARVREFAGFEDAAMDDPEVRELVIPTLRADVAMHEHFFDASVRLRCPITAIRGDEDTLVSNEDLSSWNDVASDPVNLVNFPGGHMYLIDKPEPLVELLLAHGA